jgi:hypothetical protein
MPAGWSEIGNIKGPAGTPGDQFSTGVIGEVPAGLINGGNKIFTTAFSFQADSVAVYLNGVRTFDFAITGAAQFTMGTAPITGDNLSVDYEAIAPPSTPVYITDKARFFALSNGVRLEVKDSGGVWQPQQAWTE